MIRCNIVVFLAKWIHPVPTSGDRIVLPCAIVVGVQAVHLVEFLAVVLMILHATVRGAIAEQGSKGIVVQRLDDPSVTAAVHLPHLSDVPQVVTVVVAEREVVLAVVADVLPCLAVALLEPVLVDAPVLQCESTADQVVRGVRSQYLRGEELPGAADGDADVRNRRQVRDPQLLARGAVDVPGHAAVGELDAHGIVHQVVVYPRYPAPGIITIFL